MHNTDALYDETLRTAGCARNVIVHCHRVRDLALSYCDHSGIADCELINTGALLHDIGRGTTHSLSHAQVGAALCRRIGLPEPVARIIECHIGAGLTADECSLLRLLPIESVPVSLEEKIVTNADNLVRGDRDVTIHERLDLIMYLNRKIRSRIYRLWLETEQFRRC
jgi:uncharacterized protein